MSGESDEEGASNDESEECSDYGDFSGEGPDYDEEASPNDASEEGSD